LVFPEKDREAEAQKLLQGPDWYRNAIFYEVFVRSFQDTNGDGIGDLPGLTSRLDYLKNDLRVDALWLMPIMPTPFKDSGYDVADYLDIHPEYGTLEDFDVFLKAAHERGIRVLIDLVLNHTSDQHAWFQESRSSRDNPKADWYVWSDTPSSPDNGCGPQNIVFGNDPWTYDETRGQYYFHRFYPEQPDLNYRNPEVVAATLDAARFWLDRGVDGFRCDVIALLFESATKCDLLPETVGYIQDLRKLVDGYGDRVLVAESTDFNSAAPYFGNGSDMFHIAFNFGYGYFWGLHFHGTSASGIKDVFARAQRDYPPGAQDGLVIGSHDVSRAFQVAQGEESRHRRAALIQFTMPGSPYIYYGEELGLRPGTQTVVDLRDSARTPMLWSGESGHGFTTATPWLAFGAEADSTHLAAQQNEPESMFAYYRDLIGLRRGRDAFATGTLKLLDTDTSALLVYTRTATDEAYLVAINMDEDEARSTVLRDEDFPSNVPVVLGKATLSGTKGSLKLTVPAAGGAVFRTR
jgi:alpha-glucosidase